MRFCISKFITLFFILVVFIFFQNCNSPYYNLRVSSIQESIGNPQPTIPQHNQNQGGGGDSFDGGGAAHAFVALPVRHPQIGGTRRRCPGQSHGGVRHAGSGGRAPRGGAHPGGDPGSAGSGARRVAGPDRSAVGSEPAGLIEGETRGARDQRREHKAQ